MSTLNPRKTRNSRQYHSKNSADLENMRQRIFTDPEEAQSGGFGLGLASDGNPLQDAPRTDTEILNRACSYNANDRITSNYWKIPDMNYSYLTAFSNHNDKPYLAVSNSSRDSNLMIYELDADKKLLSHHQSITLPNITSLQWLDSVTPTEKQHQQRDDIDFLLTGHSDGSAHLTIIPEPENDVFQNAEIIKRFNHKKQIQSEDIFASDAITKMEVSPRRWRSCNMNSMFSLYKSNLFMWDTTRSRAPIVKYKSIGIKNFNTSPCNDGLLGICGDYGIALLDLRAAEGTPSLYVPEYQCSTSAANNIKWSPFDSNVLASSYEDGIVRLWDVRMTKTSFARLEGHKDTVTAVEWSEVATNDLFTSSKDGNIIHWDLSDVSNYITVEEELKCSLKRGLEAVNLVNKNGKIELVNDLIRTRQCGTAIPASTNGIVDLIHINDGKILSIDGSSYLGLHDKNTGTKESQEVIMTDLLNAMSSADLNNSSSSGSTVESSSGARTPVDQSFGFSNEEHFADSIASKLTPSSPASTRVASDMVMNSPQRISSDSSSPTLVGSPVLNKRQSCFETMPLPYHESALPKTYTAHSNSASKAKFRHKKTHSAKFFVNKLRDFSGSTLNHNDESESADDMLTDLAMEDNFTFKAVFPLDIKHRQAI